MADVPMVLPGPNGNGIAGKIKKGKVYISGTAMEHDAGKSFADYMRLQETKDYIEDLAAREGVASHTFSHKTAEILWLYAPQARHFGKWLEPRYATLVDIFCIQLHKKPKQKTPS